MKRAPALALAALLASCTSPGDETESSSSGSSQAAPGSSSTGAPAPTTSGAGDGSSSTTTTDTGDAPASSSSSGGGALESGESGPPPADLPQETGWRSALYPDDWTPAFTDREGRFLHDFSYAGYRNGEAPLAQDVADTVIDVVADHGADPLAMDDATAAFQAAFDAAAQAGGAVVAVPAGLYRIDGQLALQGSRVVVRGEGAAASRLWFTAFMGVSFASHVQVGGPLTLSDEAPLVADGAARARTVEVADASAFAPGDDVAIGWNITPEFVAEHGMDGTWMTFNDEWQAFFWRTVEAVEGGTITLDVPLRYPALLRDQASVKKVDGYLREVGFEDLGVADAVGWDDAWDQDQVHVLSLRGVKDAWVRGVESFPSPGAPLTEPGVDRHLQSGGILIVQGKRVTVADSTLAFPEHRGEGGNGYLFEVSQSSEVLFRDCVGRAGRHNFIQNWGFGATGIVWLRIHSLEGKAVAIKTGELGLTGLSEFHHSLATANLIDQSTLDDGWGAVNRGSYSSGAGHSATQSAVWNPGGVGTIRSRQFGHGYVIGPGPELSVETAVDQSGGEFTAPEDWVERAPQDADGPLVPASLYEDQLARRLGG